MAKDKAEPVNPPAGIKNQQAQSDSQPKPLSGSKKVKNQNHSRQNHGEGS